MDPQDTRFENEFAQELPAKTMQEFNTLQSFSAQPTSLLETTLIDTLGLSMHNAVVNQQQSHMTTAASITNACARLLQTKAIIPSAPKEEDAKPEAAANAIPPPTPKEPKKEQGKLSVLGFLKGDKKGKKGANAEAAPTPQEAPQETSQSATASPDASANANNPTADAPADNTSADNSPAAGAQNANSPTASAQSAAPQATNDATTANAPVAEASSEQNVNDKGTPDDEQQ